jgi:hypothetical protein
VEALKNQLVELAAILQPGKDRREDLVVVVGKAVIETKKIGPEASTLFLF